MNKRVHLLGLVLLLPFHSVLAADMQGTPLTGNDIKRVFANFSAVCIKEKDKSSCVTYMGADGAVKRLTHKDDAVRSGTWHADEGNQLCIRWTGKTKDLCFDVTSLPNRTYLLYRKGKLKSTILGFMPGDTIGDFSGS